MARGERAREIGLAAGVLLVAGAVFAVASRPSRTSGDGEARCGAGLVARGPRCCPGAEISLGSCASAPVLERRVLVPRTSLVVGPSDWEGEGRVQPRTIVAGPFFLDAHEATVRAYHCPACVAPDPARMATGDLARAVGRLSRDQAAAYCAHRGGRLPTEAEWIVAATGPKGSRYPWGDTGAVCRRAAWGLEAGPCALSATGPDTAGAHPDGATPLGVEDLAGNVAEWVSDDPPQVRGGSFRSSLATELRIWARRELPASSHEPDVGARCAYDHDVVER